MARKGGIRLTPLSDMTRSSLQIRKVDIDIHNSGSRESVTELMQ